MVVRREEGVARRYVHIGTGNYHPSTARLYTDLGLFTCREDVTADVSDLFNHLTGFGRPQALPQAVGGAAGAAPARWSTRSGAAASSTIPTIRRGWC